MSRTREHGIASSGWKAYPPLIAIAFAAAILPYTLFYSPSWHFNWDGIRAPIKDSVQVLAQTNFIYSGIHGIGGGTPKIYHSRRWIMGKATIEELEKLTTYPRGVVKATAYEALFRKGQVDARQLMQSALNDSTTFVEYVSGCEGEYLMLSEYFMNHVLYLNKESPYYYIDRSGGRQQWGLTDNELAEIDSLYQKSMKRKWEYFHAYYDPR